MSDNIVYDYWEGYEEAMDKEEYLKIIIDNIDEVLVLKDKVPENHYRQTLALALRSYFDDLLEYSYEKYNPHNGTNRLP